MSRHWSPMRHGLRYVVASVAKADFLGAWYTFARENGKVRRFWRRKNAQQYARHLNGDEQ